MIEMFAAAMAGAAVGQFHYANGETDALRPIATAAPAPAINGRLFVTRPVMGGRGVAPVTEGEPGASYYGAFDRQDAVVYARVGHTTIGINPWERLESEGLRHIEKARAFWLQEQNYTGGVRTFVSDAVTWKPAEPVAVPPPTDAPAAAPKADAGEPAASGEIKPRATIRVPADLPRAKSRIRVERSLPTTPVATPSVVTVRVSLPPGAPAELAARANAYAGEAGRVVAAGRAE